MMTTAGLTCAAVTDPKGLGEGAWDIDEDKLVASTVSTKPARLTACCTVSRCKGNAINLASHSASTEEKRCDSTGCKDGYAWLSGTGGGKCTTKCPANQIAGGTVTSCAAKESCGDVTDKTGCAATAFWNTALFCNKKDGDSGANNAFCKANGCCATCHSSCKTCANGNSCKECKDAHFKAAGTANNWNCLSCDPSCKTCDKESNGDAKHKCRTCKDGYFGKESSANIGTSKAKECIKCHTSCGSCDGTGDKKCLTCANSAHLIDAPTGSGKCVAKCTSPKKDNGKTPKRCVKTSFGNKLAMNSLATLMIVMLHWSQ